MRRWIVLRTGWLAACAVLLFAGLTVDAAEALAPFESAELVPLTWSSDLRLAGLGDAPECCEGLGDRTTLLGDIGGMRTCLGSHGIKLDISSTEFYQGVAEGGNNQDFEFGGRNDYYVTADGHKLGLWEGLLIELHGETRYGKGVNAYTGALSPVNMSLLFPVPDEITSLTQVKFTQIVNERLAVFAGKINLVDGYLNPFAAGKGQTQFMNTAFCLPPIFAGPVPVYSSLGAGFAVLHGAEPVFSMMVLDPVNNPTTSGFEEFFENGVALFGELSIPVTIAGRPGHQDLFFAWSNRSKTALDDVVYIDTPEGPVFLFEEINRSWTLMYAFDQYLYVDPCDAKRGWGVFGQFGISDGNPSVIRWSATMGAGGSSPFRSRPLDSFGLAYYYFQTSTALKQTLAPTTVQVGNEHGVELYYNIGVTQWLHITPDVQWIEPAGQASDAAVVVGVRAKVDF